MNSSRLSSTSDLRPMTKRSMISSVSLILGATMAVSCMSKGNAEETNPTPSLPQTAPVAATQTNDPAKDASSPSQAPTTEVSKSSKEQSVNGPTNAAKTMPMTPMAANIAPRDELAQLRIEVLSLKEKVSSLQRKFDVILKGQRSGLYDESAVSETISQFRNPKSKTNAVPPLTSEGPIDRFDDNSDIQRRDKALSPEKPEQIVERAIVLLEQREFGRVAQMLENFQQRFPNNGLSATAELTLAEAYVELKSPQQALTHVRTFYLQHPNDAQLIRAKWLEGRSQEQLDAPQKAAQLFREIIALDPQSELALRARAALEKIAGGSTQ